ncbi:MAG TPA: hypothetical protein VMG34_06450 [Bacteroidota bacterium]|nr:hypothetical protein [Bacteroidota bacterium]
MRNQRRTKIRHTIATMLRYLLTFASAALAQTPQDLPPSRFFSPKYSSIVLADVGPWKITAQEFLLNYEYGPAFTKREADSKKHYLAYMVYEKLLALDGYSRNIETSPMVKEILRELEADFATEELYKDDVLSKVKVSGADIDRAVAKENIHLTLRWLFSTSKDTIFREARLLRDGVAFDSLFAAECPDSAAMENRSMASTKFRLEMKNPALAAAVDTHTAGTVTPPIAAPDGWYIVNVSDVWKNAVVNEGEEMKMKEDVRRALVEHRSDSLSDQYVHRMLLARNPVIEKEPFNLLAVWMGKKFLPPAKFDAWRLDSALAASGTPLDPDSAGGWRSRILVRMTDGSLLFGDFLEWEKTRDPYIRLDLRSPHSFLVSVEDLIWRMVRDRTLAEEAYRRGLQKRENVAKQTRWWEEKLVYKAVRLAIDDSVQRDDSTVARYYREHERDYRDDKGAVRPFRDVKDDVARDSFAYQETSLLLHKILRLKEQYHVNVNDGELKRLHVDEENDPKAIDVYTVKKGGIFPHEAFPSIDIEWQGWD